MRISVVLAQAYAGQSRWTEARQVLAAVSDGSNVQAARAALCVDEFDASYASPVAPSANPGLPPTRETAAFGLLVQALQAVPNYPPAVQRFRSALFERVASRRTTCAGLRNRVARQRRAAGGHALPARSLRLCVAEMGRRDPTPEPGPASSAVRREGPVSTGPGPARGAAVRRDPAAVGLR